jgi:rfaE bifunctional protein nucleotidyltransferase chain/domain
MKVWVNGTFDVLHIGHIRLLEFAHKYGKLRVGVDTDERVRSLKGDSRPFNTLEDRIRFLESIKYVDSVVSFGSDEELAEKIQEWETDIMVVGDDYKYKKVIGAEFAERTLFYPKIENKSTSKILNYEKNLGDR